MKKSTSLIIICLLSVSSLFAQHNWKRVNYPSSTIFTGIVTINGEAVAEGSGTVGIFVGTECRMVADVRVLDGVSYVSAVAHVSDSIKNPEKVSIKYYENSTKKIYNLDTSFNLTIHGDVRMFPISLLKADDGTNLEINIVGDNTKVFPVPFETELKVKAEKEIKSITITDEVGKGVLFVDNVNLFEYVFQTERLASGVYMVEIIFIDATKTVKRVVKN